MSRLIYLLLNGKYGVEMYSIFKKGNADESYLEKILSFRGGKIKEDVAIVPSQYALDILNISRKRDWKMYKVD